MKKMINLRPVHTTEDSYQFIENLLHVSFPLEERRDDDKQRYNTDFDDLFTAYVAEEDNEPVGLITCWNFDYITYVEHFAIDPNRRNGGYGKKILELLKQKVQSPIVLEVELPNEEISKRRIGFYERSGFKLIEKPYMQPAYRETDEELPLYLMVQGDYDMETNFEKVVHSIHHAVYGK